MNFLEKFREICATVDTDILGVVSVGRYDRREPKKVVLFDIYKRSLPPGINKAVLIGLTKADAEKWLEDKLKAKVFHDEVRDYKTLIYYDMVPQNALPHERSIYFNADDTKGMRERD